MGVRGNRGPDPVDVQRPRLSDLDARRRHAPLPRRHRARLAQEPRHRAPRCRLPGLTRTPSPCPSPRCPAPRCSPSCSTASPHRRRLLDGREALGPRIRMNGVRCSSRVAQVFRAPAVSCRCPSCVAGRLRGGSRVRTARLRGMSASDHRPGRALTPVGSHFRRLAEEEADRSSHRRPTATFVTVTESVTDVPGTTVALFGLEVVATPWVPLLEVMSSCAAPGPAQTGPVADHLRPSQRSGLANSRRRVDRHLDRSDTTSTLHVRLARDPLAGPRITVVCGVRDTSSFRSGVPP